MTAPAEGPTIVLIPGHLCDARLYAPQRPLLDAHGAVRVAETRLDESIEGMAARLLAEVPGRFAALGLSMGGMVATALLARAPERVLGAALLDTDPFPARPVETAWRAEQVARVRTEGLGPYIDAFTSRFFAHAPERSAALVAETRAMMRSTPVETFERQSRALDGRGDTRAAVAAYSGPLAVIWGGEDRVCPPRLHAEIAAAPTAAATEIPDCGHLATLEAPEAVNRALERWLARLPPS